MESESGKGTEGGSGRWTGQELLLDLGSKLDYMEIELGKWTEEASGKEQETVLDLRKKHRKLNKKRRYLSMGIDSGKVTEVDSDSGRNKVMGMLREAKELEKELMIIKEKEKEKQLLKKRSESGKGMESESGKGTVIESGKEPEKERDSGKEPEMKGEVRKEQRKLRKKQTKLLKKMRVKSRKGTEGGSGKEQETWDLTSERSKLEEKEREIWAKLSKKRAEEGDFRLKELVVVQAELRKLEMQIGIKEQMQSSKLRKKQRKLLKSFGIVRGQEMDTDSGEHQSLIKEIISLGRERKDLLGSLTPTFSLWKEVDSQTTWTIARKEPATATARDDENQLAEYFNLMLQDMEDLGHRMLSMLYFLNKSNDPICSYKATELCSTTTKLNMQISKGFSMNHEPEQEPEPEPGQINLSTLFRKYYRFPNNYDNTLAQLDMEEEETKCEDVKVKKTKEEEDKENDPSTIEYFKKSMELDQYFFAEDRTYWENGWASKIGRCGGFANTTILSPMQFTHYTPGSIPSPAAVTGSTLQIYSIKIKNLKGLNWPLKVYGKVAARDTVDRNRNILFSRPKFDYQELNGEDDSLCLTGPSRAIVALGHVDFEVELKVIEGAESQRLIICKGRYGGTDDCPSSSASVIYGGDGPTFLLSNHRCTTEVTLEQLDRSHQATIVGIRVTKGDWPFKHGCRVICFWAPASATDVIDTTCRPIILLDDRGKEIHPGSGKYLHLSRRVVSVESHGILRVAIEAYGEPGQCIARQGHVDFPVKQCQTTAFDCVLGDTTLEVVVAWSFLVKDKVDLQVFS